MADITDQLAAHVLCLFKLFSHAVEAVSKLCKLIPIINVHLDPLVIITFCDFLAGPVIDRSGLVICLLIRTLEIPAITKAAMLEKSSDSFTAALKFSYNVLPLFPLCPPCCSPSLAINLPICFS